MTTDPTTLATKLVTYITTNPGCTYSGLLARAITHGLSEDTLLQALTLVHKNKAIKTSTSGGEITYSLAMVKPITAISHVSWIKDHYPPMDSTNDGSGIDVDFSYLFLRPEELEQYKAEAKGRGFIPRKKNYEYANKK